MRSATNQANTAATTAANTGTQLGAEGQAIGSTVTPFLTSELEHPQGFSQQDMSGMLSAAEGGAGGADAGIVGQAAQRAATSRNAGGFQSALDDAARQREKAAAGTSEGIAGQNAQLKQQQMQQGAAGLEHMYGTDESGMLGAMGQQANDINAEVNAGKSGWLQNAQSIIKQIATGGAGYTPGAGA
jgi:hypothetical protein